MRIYWGETPKEVIVMFSPYIERWRWLLPTWCHQLHVQLGGGEEESGGSVALAITPNYENRFATLHVHDGWMESTERNRHLYVAHEFIHVLVAPMQDALEMVVKDLTDDDSTERKLIKRVFEKAVESVVEDTSAAIVERLDPIDAARQSP